MTREKQRYTTHIIRHAKNSLFSEAIVSMALIGSALMLLEKLV